MNYNRVFPVDHPDAAPASSHIVPYESAVAMVEAHAASGLLPKHLFHVEAVIKLITQVGCAGICLKPAYNGHHDTVVIFAVDSQGKELEGSTVVALENGQQCPPSC